MSLNFSSTRSRWSSRDLTNFDDQHRWQKHDKFYEKKVPSTQTWHIEWKYGYFQRNCWLIQWVPAAQLRQFFHKIIYEDRHFLAHQHDQEAPPSHQKNFPLISSVYIDKFLQPYDDNLISHYIIECLHMMERDMKTPGAALHKLLSTNTREAKQRRQRQQESYKDSFRAIYP